jgi:Tfp pilus assembly protein PilO
MALVQLDFFEKDTTSELKQRMEAVEDSAMRCRKKQFAEIGALKKQVYDLSERLAIMERNICHERN